MGSLPPNGIAAKTEPLKKKQRLEGTKKEVKLAVNLLTSERYAFQQSHQIEVDRVFSETLSVQMRNDDQMITTT